MNDDRYAAHYDRADLLICRECSTRVQVVTIPADEDELHNQWHAAAAGVHASPSRVTQYGIDHRGTDLGITFATREDVDRYIAQAISHGGDPSAYQVKHRAVTYGDWAPTTPAPAQRRQA